MPRAAPQKNWHGVRHISELRNEILEFARAKQRRLRVHGEILDLRRFGDTWWVTLLDAREREVLEVSFNVVYGQLQRGAMVAVDGVLQASHREGEQGVYYKLRGETCEVKHAVARRYRERQACVTELLKRYGEGRKLFGTEPIKRFWVLTGAYSKARFDIERMFWNHRHQAEFEVCDLHSAADIAAKLDTISARVQVGEAIALTRGGGSPLELDVFDAPDVARALMRATLAAPTLLAVGHAADELLVHQIVSEVCYTPTHAARRMSWWIRSDNRHLAAPQLADEPTATGAAKRPMRRNLAPPQKPFNEAPMWIALAIFVAGLLIGWWIHVFVL